MPKQTESQTTPKWKMERPIEGGNGGCLHCGYQHDILPMDSIIAVGFGMACLTKNGECVFDEQQGFNPKFVDKQLPEGEYLTVGEAEKIAIKDPDNDWRIYLHAPLSDREYQRQGDLRWVLYKKGMGFA